MRKEIKINALIVSGSRILGIVSNFLFNALLARAISQNDMGWYFLVLSLVSFCAIFARAGCENVVMKLISDALSSESVNRLESLFGIVGRFFLITSGLSFLVGWWIFPLSLQYIFHAANLIQLTPILCLWFVLLAAQILLGQMLRAFKLFISCSLLNGPLSAMMNFVGLFILNTFLREIDIYHIALMVCFNTFLVNFVAAFILLKQLGIASSNEAFDRENVGIGVTKLAGLSFPLWISQIALYLGSQSDIWLLSAYLPSDNVALYGAAAKLVLLTTMAMSIANGVLPPYISEYRNKGDLVGLQVLLRKVATLVSLPAVVFLLIVLCMPDQVLSLVYGAGYSHAAEILQVLAVGQLVNVMVGSCGYVLIMYGLNRLVMSITLFFGVLMVFGAYLLLELGEAFGVAVLVSVIMGLQQLTMLYYAKKKCGVLTAIKVF